MRKRNSLLTESKAFLKSIAINLPLILNLSVYSKMSSTVLTASKIVLPLTYAHWLKCIILGRTHSSLLEIAFDPNLKSTLIRDIGLQLEDRQRERDKEEDQLIKRFYEAFDAWKAQASDIERYIADQLPLSQTDKDENILRLKDLHVSALTIYEKLRKFRPPGQEIRQKIDACDALTKTLEHQLKQSEDSNPMSRNDRRSV